MHTWEQTRLSIIESLPDETGLERRASLDSLFELGEPKVLGTKDDPLWLAPALDGVPNEVAADVNERFKDAVKKRNDEGKNDDIDPGM
jgi:hypothetical protein